MTRLYPSFEFLGIFLVQSLTRCADGGSVVVCSSCSSIYTRAIILLFLQHSNFNQGYERLCGKLHKRKPNFKIFTISNCCRTTIPPKCNRVTPWQISDSIYSFYLKLKSQIIYFFDGRSPSRVS